MDEFKPLFDGPGNRSVNVKPQNLVAIAAGGGDLVGVRVRCEGLSGAAELNGGLGRVVSHGHEGARAMVRVDGRGLHTLTSPLRSRTFGTRRSRKS